MKTYCERNYGANCDTSAHYDGSHNNIFGFILYTLYVKYLFVLTIFLDGALLYMVAMTVTVGCLQFTAYSIPSRIRVDHGGENNMTYIIMEHLRGAGRDRANEGTYIINLLNYRDWICGMEYQKFTIAFFIFSEHRGSLSVDNIHMWSLHCVFASHQ